MRLVSIVGARPQFIKLAPVCRTIQDREGVQHVIVHTGQHYDQAMSQVFFSELGIPEADINLGIGSGSHGRQTGRMLERTEEILLSERPDMVITYGDTNSTVAGSLAAAKLHIPVAHVEAGLRSFNRRMPEELNRIVADHISDLLLAPTPTAMDNLVAERLEERAVYTGDLMYDAVLFNRELAREGSTIVDALELKRGRYGIVTLHRAESTDGDHLRTLLQAINEVADRYLPLVFPAHPRTTQRVRSNVADWVPCESLSVIEPVGYLDMLSLLDNAAMILTDSGGLQKEAYFLGCPCVTLRSETEWLETVSGGGNVLTGVEVGEILTAVQSWMERPERGDSGVAAWDRTPFGGGDAAGQIVDAISAFPGMMNASVSTGSPG